MLHARTPCANASAKFFARANASRNNRARSVAAPAPSAYSLPMRTTGKVKWFDPGKGDGCVVSDGGTQAALSPATLSAAGLQTIAPGTPLTYEVKLAAETLTVTAIY